MLRLRFSLMHWCILSIFIGLADFNDIATQSVYSMTPMHSNSLDLVSCIQAIGDGSHVDRNMLVSAADGSGTSQNIAITGTSTSCVSLDTSSFRFNMDTQSESVRLRLVTSSDGSVHDAYLPLPLLCLGNEYMVSTWSPQSSGTSFIAIFNPNSDVITTHVTLDQDLPASTNVQVDGGPTLSPGDGDSLEIGSYQVKYLTSSTSSLDGLVVSGQQNFAVYAGNTDTAMFQIGVSNHFLEMFPPTSFFQDNYIVPVPTHLTYAMLKVIALNSDTPVSTTTFGYPVTFDSRTLTFKGEAWTISQRDVISVQSNKPVMVVQYCPDVSWTESPSMVLIPPTMEWTSSVMVHPLDIMDSFNQVVELMVLTSQVSDVTAFSVTTNSDMTSSLVFLPIDQSDYSRCDLLLLADDVIWFNSTSGTTFQVIQYNSGIGNDVRAYSFRSGLHSTCLQALNSTEIIAVTSSTYFQEVYIYIGVGILCLFLIATPMTLAYCLKAKSKQQVKARTLTLFTRQDMKGRELFYTKGRWAVSRQ